jgi:hypothetical protein
MSLRRFLIVVAALLGALLLSASAAATTETFRFFEVNADARYRVVDQCEDGSTRTAVVMVTAGHEEEQVNDETVRDRDFLTVLLSGATCDQTFGFVRALGTGEFTWSPSLQSAAISGTATDGEHVVNVDMSWEGVGPIESTSTTSIREGFVGHFQGKERDAVATGTVVVNGQTIVNGSTTNASIETLEDNNRTTGA